MQKYRRLGHSQTLYRNARSHDMYESTAAVNFEYTPYSSGTSGINRASQRQQFPPQTMLPSNSTGVPR